MATLSRLSVARHRRGLSKEELAHLVGVTTNTILQYEDGGRLPSDYQLDRIADVLRFPKSFLCGPKLNEIRRADISFRDGVSNLGKTMHAALAYGAIAFLLDDWLKNQIAPPVVDVPDLQSADAAAAANFLHQYWRLSSKPITDIVRLLEGRGVRIFALAEDVKDVGTFSLWRAGVPYVFLNPFETPERICFDAAHELAHLCLHKHGGANSEYLGNHLEKEANTFARVFLNLDGAIRSTDNPQANGVYDLGEYRRRRGTSIFNYSPRTPGLAGDQVISNPVQHSCPSWQTTVRGNFERPPPVGPKVFSNDLRWGGISEAEIADAIGVPASEIELLAQSLPSTNDVKWRLPSQPVKERHNPHS